LNNTKKITIMKKIFTFLFFAGLMTSAMAQNSRNAQYRNQGNSNQSPAYANSGQAYSQPNSRYRVTTKIMATIKMNRPTTTTMKTVMVVTSVLMKGAMIAGFVTTNGSTSGRMVMKEEGNLKGITVEGSMPGFPSGLDNLPATNK
jgi:hypothetical protein